MSFLSADQVSRVYSERIFDLARTTRKRRQILCPLPDHKHHNYTPSFSIFWADNRWRWRCHGNCDRQGDVIDLVGFMQVPLYDKRDPHKLGKAIGILSGNGYQPVVPKPPKREKKIVLSPNMWREFLPPGHRVVTYARKRGLSEATLEHFQIGQHENWMTIPAFRDQRLIGIKMRNTGPGLRYRQIRGSVSGLFNHDAVKYALGRVFVTKGEIAAMVLCQHGFLACAPTGGESMQITEDMATILALADVVVIGDNDRGERVRAKTRALAEERALALNAELFFPPEQFKDVDEWILKDEGAVEVLKEV